MRKFLNEVNERLLEHRKDKPDQKENETLIRIKLPVPLVRKELKNPYSFFEKENTEVLKIWNHIWNHSDYFEVMSQALYFYQGKSLSKLEIDQIKNWVNRLHCWEHSDDLSKIIAQVVEEHSQWILPDLKKWNQSNCLWKRRQSIVGLIEYASKRKKVLPFQRLISFVNPLLNDPEYYVQKGIGWTLREIYNVYPNETLEYLKKNLVELSPIAYSPATEKLDRKIKQILNEKRKQLRKKKA